MHGLMKTGDLYKVEGTGGYVMIMKINGDMITYSPLFWTEKIVTFKSEKNDFMRHHEKSDHPRSIPVVEARLDHEIMRRWNCIIKSQ